MARCRHQRAAIGLRGCLSAGAGLARPVRRTGRPLWLGRLCAPEEEEEEAAVARERRAPSRPAEARPREETVRGRP